VRAGRRLHAPPGASYATSSRFAGVIRGPNVMVMTPLVQAKRFPLHRPTPAQSPQVNMARPATGARPSGRRVFKKRPARHGPVPIAAQRPRSTDIPRGQVQVCCHHALVDELHSDGRQAARPSGDHATRSENAAGHPDRRPSCAGLRGEQWNGVGAPKATQARSSRSSTRRSTTASRRIIWSSAAFT